FLPTDPLEEVLFIPDDCLFSVPFASLYDKDNDEYLIQQHTISISPSIQVASLKRSHRNDNRWMESLLNPNEKDIIVIGNPDPMPIIDGKPLSSLPGSE